MACWSEVFRQWIRDVDFLKICSSLRYFYNLIKNIFTQIICIIVSILKKFVGTDLFYDVSSNKFHIPFPGPVPISTNSNHF